MDEPKFNIDFIQEHPREISFFLGEKLGSGCYRDVFDFFWNKNYVIKIAISTEGRQENLLESRIHDCMLETNYIKHFAKVLGVSASGEFLIMEKAEKRPPSQYPEKVPHFFSDLKYDNYGWIGKRFVCFDYGNLMVTNGMTNKMKKANWWDPKDE